MPVSNETVGKLQSDCGLSPEECRHVLEQHGGDPEAALLALIDADQVPTNALNPDTVSNACFSRAVRRDRIARFRKMLAPDASPFDKMMLPGGGGLSAKLKEKYGESMKDVFVEKTPEEMADEEERKDAARREEIRFRNPQVPANAGEWARTDSRNKRRLGFLKENPTTLDSPPFPALAMKLDEWEGTDILPAWAGTQSRQGAYTSRSDGKPSDGTVSLEVPRLGDTDDANPRPPAPEFVAAYQHFKENGQTIKETVLAALLVQYVPLRARWLENDPDLTDEDLPVIDSIDQMKDHVGLGIVHLLPVAKHGMAYIGLELGCTWDEEHGAGVLLHGSRVVAVGAGDEAFNEHPCLVDGGEDLTERAGPPAYLTLEAADRGETWPPAKR
jgi:hypothetical protein